MIYILLLIILIIIIFFYFFINKETFKNIPVECTPKYKKIELFAKEETNSSILTINNIINELSQINIDDFIKVKSSDELNKLSSHVQKVYDEIKLYQPENNDEADQKKKAINLINNYLEKLLKNTLNKTIEENITPIPENKVIILELINNVNNSNLEKFHNDIINSDLNILNKLLNDTNNSLDQINNFSPDNDTDIQNKLNAINIMNKYKTILENQIKVRSNIEINMSILDILYKETTGETIPNIINTYNLDQLREFSNKIIYINDLVAKYVPTNNDEINKKEIITKLLNSYLDKLNNKINQNI